MGFARDISGSAVVEAVILFPVLIFGGLGALDAALLVQQTHRMEAGLGAAGSYLAQGEANAQQRGDARRIAVRGLTGDAPHIRGWQESDVSVTVRDAPGSDGQYRSQGAVRIAELSSEMTYRGVGILRRVTGERLTVNARHEVRIAR